MKITTIHDYVNEYNKIIRDAMSQAWEEGYQASQYNMEAYEACPLGMTPKRKTNPYREES